MKSNFKQKLKSLAGKNDDITKPHESRRYSTCRLQPNRPNQIQTEADKKWWRFQNIEAKF